MNEDRPIKNLSATSTVRELMERGKTSICGSEIKFTVDDLTDDEFDVLYDLMDDVYPVGDTLLRKADPA